MHLSPSSARADNRFPYTSLFLSPDARGRRCPAGARRSLGRLDVLIPDFDGAVLSQGWPGMTAAEEQRLAEQPVTHATVKALDVAVPMPATRGRRRSEENTSELQSLMRNSYTVFRLKKKIKH